MISVLTAYLCCQLRRWLALIAVAIFSGGDTMQYAVEIIITVPMLILLLKAAPAIRSVSQYSRCLLYTSYPRKEEKPQPVSG